MKKSKLFLTLMRPQQWTKNLLVFAALIFSNNLFNIKLLKFTVLAFFTFCLTSSVIYIFNDWRDTEKDRNHPEKKNRPLAARTLTIKEAFILGLINSVIIIFLAIIISNRLWILLLIYSFLNILYTLIFKQIAILDILVVSMGFILRVISGAIIIGVQISNWLLVCTFFLSLFLLICKRRFEFISLGTDATQHRKNLSEYSIQMLDQMIAIVTALSIISYSIYTLDSKTIQRFNTENLIYTIPFVVLGVFRYLYVIYKKELGGKPEEILLKDKHIQFTIILWLVSVIIIIYK